MQARKSSYTMIDKEIFGELASGVFRHVEKKENMIISD